MHDLADSATGPILHDHVEDPGEPSVPPRLADAVDLARAAAVDAADGEADQVGEALAVHAEDADDSGDQTSVTAATHYLAADKPGYRGWTWAVTVMVADDDPDAPVTIGEVALLPGAGAVVAPEWIPWNERVRAEDLAPGDLLPVDSTTTGSSPPTRASTTTSTPPRTPTRTSRSGRSPTSSGSGGPAS